MQQRNVSQNVRQVQQQGQVQYEISFPRSLQNNQQIFGDVYQEIMGELQAAAVINISPAKRDTSIICTVNTNDQYFFLSQLQLLKTKHIEYGIYWNNPR
jgi:hypothetical protein